MSPLTSGLFSSDGDAGVVARPWGTVGGVPSCTYSTKLEEQAEGNPSPLVAVA